MVELESAGVGRPSTYGELKGGRAARGEAAQGRGCWTGFPSRRGHPIGDDKLSAFVRPLGIAAVRPGQRRLVRLRWRPVEPTSRLSAQVVAAADPPGASRPLCPIHSQDGDDAADEFLALPLELAGRD